MQRTALVRILGSAALRREVRRVPACSMYNHPYTERFKQLSQASPDFYKQTTGLTGMFVNEKPHYTLKAIYGRILRVVANMPSDAEYRVNTEAIVKHRLSMVEREPDMEKLEELIGMGQLEEVIEQAILELETARFMERYKPWEPLVEAAPEGQWRWPIH